MVGQINSQDFKAVMSHWPTGVAVVTTNYNNRLFGLTVNSFTSVSLSPPLISFCLNQASGSVDAFKNTTKFMVNILAENQNKVAKHFAASHIDKFKQIKYTVKSLNSCPIINGVACWLECEKLYEYEGGDHIILVAKVQLCWINHSLMPLVYFARDYKMIK